MSLITEEQPPSGTEDMLSEYLVRMFRDAATSDDISDQFHVRTALPEKPITGKLYYFKQIINTVIYREGFYWYDATTSTWRFLGVSDFYLDVARGLVPGHSLVHKFGAGQVPNGTFAAITYTGIYPTPTTAQSLEFVSDDAQDGVGGTGAREVTICGIDANWERITQTIPTNGIAAVAIPINFIRLCRWWVSSSGTYAATGSASQAGNLTIRLSGGGTVWDTIPLAPLGESQSSIGAYTLAKGETAYLLSKSIFVDSNKDADLYFFNRSSADDVASPYDGIRRVIEKDLAMTGPFEQKPVSPRASFIGPCDIGFMGKGNAAVADVSVEFELLIIADGY